MKTKKIVRRLLLGLTLIAALSAASCLKNAMSVAERDPGCAPDTAQSAALQAKHACRDIGEVEK